ncbi:peptidase inhibitor family I36 protein [Streptomyces sp. NPDC021020]|uniref:peptidase inhibitor family I36 protein n=1 Tax=Streptomyces sp. NPDC021020 TaxID=3365109 RepID=UPI00379FF544
MMTKAALVLAAMLTAGLPLAAPASADDSGVREIRGHGLSACPERSLCLYQDTDFNGTSNARIWIITKSVPDLGDYDANDRTSSVYLNSPPDWWAGLFQDTDRVGDSITVAGGTSLANLRHVEIDVPEPHTPSRWGSFNDEASSVQLWNP